MPNEIAKGTLAGASSVVALAVSTTAAAQEQQTGPQDVREEVVVTGLRGSLQRNLDIKRESMGVVDVISSEDIGKFPDSNVPDSLQRVPVVSFSAPARAASPRASPCVALAVTSTKR